MSFMTVLSIVTSMYNDEDCVKPFIEAVLDAAKDFPNSYEVNIVDNASLDNTGKMCDKYAKLNSKVIKVIHAPKPNLGKGNGVRLGIEKSSGNYIALLDPDLQQNPIDIFRLLKFLKEGDYGAVIGWRWNRKNDPFYRLFYSKIYNILVKFLFGLLIPDASGQPRIFKREAIDGYKIVNKRWGIEVELPYAVKRRGYKIGFDHVEWRQRVGNKSKVKFFTAFDILKDLIKFRLGWLN